MQRLMESRQMTERESGKLIDVQMSLDQKAALANYVVENSGNFQDLKSQVNFILLLFNLFLTSKNKLSDSPTHEFKLLHMSQRAF